MIRLGACLRCAAACGYMADLIDALMGLDPRKPQKVFDGMGRRPSISVVLADSESDDNADAQVT